MNDLYNATLLKPSLWVSGVLKDTLVSGLPSLLGLAVHPQWSRSFQIWMSFGLQPHAFSQCFAFLNFFSIKLSPSLLQFVFENSVSILCKLYSVDCCKFLITALSLLLNGMLQCRYFVTALKTIIHNNIICFCLQTLDMY